MSVLSATIQQSHCTCAAQCCLLSLLTQPCVPHIKTIVGPALPPVRAWCEKGQPFKCVRTAHVMQLPALCCHTGGQCLSNQPVLALQFLTFNTCCLCTLLWELSSCKTTYPPINPTALVCTVCTLFPSTTTIRVSMQPYLFPMYPYLFAVFVPYNSEVPPYVAYYSEAGLHPYLFVSACCDATVGSFIASRFLSSRSVAAASRKACTASST